MKLKIFQEDSMSLQDISGLFPSSFFMDSPLTKTLGEELKLCDNGSMIFHWSDFHESCDLIKAQLENDPHLMSDFISRESALERLNLIPIWIKTDSKIVHTNMHELYEKYILNQNQLFAGVDPFCPLSISFISGSGPFKSMSISECFNKNTYRDFVLVYLIRNKLPRRDFRIRLKSRVLMEYGLHFEKAELINLEQLTMNGFLFSLDSQTYLKSVAKLEKIRVLIHTPTLKEASSLGFLELKDYLSKFAFNLMYSSQKDDALIINSKDVSVQSSFDFSNNKKIYLYLTYEKMLEDNPEAIQVIKNFILHTRNIVRDHYLEKADRRTA
jgi:hypothetical protein